jgi:hypothetical protein
MCDPVRCQAPPSHLTPVRVLHQLLPDLLDVVAHHGADQRGAAVHASEEAVHARQVVVLVIAQESHQA